MTDAVTKIWTAFVEADPDSDDLLLPLPQDLLDSVGWVTGDVLVWDIQPDNSIVLRKK